MGEGAGVRDGYVENAAPCPFACCLEDICADDDFFGLQGQGLDRRADASHVPTGRGSESERECVRERGERERKRARSFPPSSLAVCAWITNKEVRTRLRTTNLCVCARVRGV